jgi:CIC family chloride channel protein
MAKAKFLETILGYGRRNLVRRLVLCIFVGVIAGLGAVSFFYLLEFARHGFLNIMANYYPSQAGNERLFSYVGSGSIRRWALLLIPAFGGLVSGLIVFTLAPEAEGHGTDAAIEAYHFKGGMVRPRVPIIKTIASAITIGSGGSGGREGPIAQIGAGFGSVIAQLMKLDTRERRLLMAAGMGAGIGAIFHAPLAGALFASEVLYRELDIEYEILVPAFVASVVASAIFGTVFGFQPLFSTPSFGLHDPLQIVPFIFLAIVSSLGAALYVAVFYGVRRTMLLRLNIPNHFKPALGGLVVGVIGFFLPEALGTGYGVVQACFSGLSDPTPGLSHLPSWNSLAALLPGATPLLVATVLLIATGLAKIGTTAFAIGSGGSGGVFGPAIVIGGALGGATGLICRPLFAPIDVQPGAFALVGMAGFFAGAAKTPVSTIIMVSEMTGNYNLLMPSMLVCILSFLFCRRFNLYEKQLPSRLEAPIHVGSMASAVLRQMTVAQALATRQPEPLITIPHDMQLREIIARYMKSTQGVLPVLDADHRLLGVIDTRNLRELIGETGLSDLVIADDIAVPAVTIRARDSLSTAIRRMVVSRHEELVVVDEQEPQKIAGMVAYANIMAAYDRHLVAAGL